MLYEDIIMDEKNNLPEEQTLHTESVETNAPAPKIHVPKPPAPSKPSPIGGIVATVIAGGLIAAVLLLGGNSGLGNLGDNNPDGNGHKHSYGEWTIVDDPTCTEAGLEERTCECGEKETHHVDALGHTEVVDAPVAATCTSTGLTEGKHCSTCGTIIVSQSDVEKIPHTYDNDYDEDCNVCGYKRDVECGHFVTETIKGYAATCTATGLTDGEKCKKCGETIVAQKTLPIVAHTYDNKYDDECNVCGYKRDTECGHFETETVKGYEATCTATGLTDGSKCKKCGEILAAQKTTPIIDHIEGDWIVDKAATKNEDGKRHTECIMCGKIMSEETIPATGSVGLAYTVNSDNKSCTITGVGNCEDSHVAIPTKIDGYNVTAIGEKAFADCTGMTYINIPDTVKSIGTRAFYGCTGLTEITIPESVTNIGTQIFYKASNLETVYYNSQYSSRDNEFLNLNHISRIVFGGSKVPSFICYYNQSVKTVEILDSVTSIDNHAFCGCSSISSIVIPDSVTNINEGAFADCTLLASIVIPNGVTSIGRSAFSGCTSLTSVVIPDSVTQIKYNAFEYCESITKVYITDLNIWYGIEFEDQYSNPMWNGAELYLNGNVVTDIEFPDTLAAINDYVFTGCTSLISIAIPDSVTKIGEFAFSGCTSLASVVIPDSITSISDGMFKGCTSLISIAIPDSVTKIDNYAFLDCSSLTSIVIPDSVTYMGGYAFAGCSSLTSIVIPDGVTDMGSSYAFAGCSSLTSVVIPVSVTSIATWVFYGCDSLKDVYYTGSKEEWRRIEIGGVNDPLKNATIHYNYVPEN